MNASVWTIQEEFNQEAAVVATGGTTLSFQLWNWEIASNDNPTKNGNDRDEKILYLAHPTISIKARLTVQQ